MEKLNRNFPTLVCHWVIDFSQLHSAVCKAYLMKNSNKMTRENVINNQKHNDYSNNNHLTIHYAFTVFCFLLIFKQTTECELHMAAL